MPFLPSLLEYSKEGLSEKLLSIKNNLDKYYEITHQEKLSLHLDFVLSDFAEDRMVKPSLDVEQTFEIFEEIFGSEELLLNIHFMGSDNDLNTVADFLKGYEMPENWEGNIYVSPKRYREFADIMSLDDGVDFRVGKWYDPKDWRWKRFSNDGCSLLMTVVAGKSGQKLTDKMTARALKKVKKYSQHDFVLDGGWSVDFDENYSNLQIVSYSSFWKRFEGEE